MCTRQEHVENNNLDFLRHFSCLSSQINWGPLLPFPLPRFFQQCARKWKEKGEGGEHSLGKDLGCFSVVGEGDRFRSDCDIWEKGGGGKWIF